MAQIKGEILKETWSVITVILSLLDQQMESYGWIQNERKNEVRKKNVPRAVLKDWAFSRAFE